MARKFVNWARTVVTRPASWAEPKSEGELVELVRASAGRRLRVVGGAHSWSRIAAPEDVAVSLAGMTGVVSIDRDRGEVRVRAGTRLRDLNAALADAGLALPIVGSIDQQSLGGLIATGTHGSSLAYGNLASLVRAMRLVTASGDVLDLHGHDPRLDGARVHLGALGIVTEVTVGIVPAFRLAETVEQIPIADVASAIETIAASAEYCKVWWLPHTPRAMVYRYERTEEPTSTSPDPARQRWIDERIMHRFVFPLALRVGRIPGLLRPVSRSAARSLVHPRRVGPSTLMLSTPMPALHREAEAVLPMARAREGVDRVVRILDGRTIRANFPLEIRFVRGDRGWMSPAYGGDVCQIGAYCHGPWTDAYFAAFWREMRACQARPHWGKELDHTADEVRALWPLAARFLALRDALDPRRLLASSFHERVLGP